MPKYTRFVATIQLKGHYFNDGGTINGPRLADFVNDGSTPTASKLKALKPKIEQVRAALLAGKTVECGKAILRPVG